MFEERKFENIVNLEEGWEVLSSDNTFHKITHVGKTVPYEIWNVRTIHHTLSCADNHILFDKDDNEIFVKDLSVGTLIQTSDGLEPVLCVYKTNKSNNMYDVQVDSSEHSYLTNGIKSHNTTVTLVFLLWFVLFHDDKKCAILANKAMQAQEILSRIQLGYIHLPKWLQVGVKSWGKKSIELENGSMLLAAATSSDSVRGFSFSCVFIDECIGGDSIITVKNKKNGEIKTISIEEFWGLCNNDFSFSNRILTKDWEVLTSDGYQDFYGIKKTRKQSIKIYFDDETHIVCSLEHKFYENKKYVYANTLKIGDCLSKKKIVDIQDNGEAELYDLLEVENGHHYTMSGVEGSNCAFIPKNIWEKFYTSTMPTISSGKESKLILVSCVTKDTMVFTPDGIKTVEDFIQKDKLGAYIVPEYTVLGKEEFNRGNIMVNSGFADTKIITSPHSEIECSLNHKLWACKNGVYDWYKVSELNVGDWISIQYGKELWGNNDDINFDYTSYENNYKNKNIYKFDKITEDLSYLIGLYISEGYIDKYSINICCGDDISNVFQNMNIQYRCSDNLHYIINSLSLCDLFRYLGFNTTCKAPQKEIPSRLFSMSRKNMVSLLQGLFDGDGCSMKSGRILYYSTSKKLIKQIQMILNNFGILSNVRSTVTKPTKKVKVKSLVYTLELNLKFSKIFYDKIGFRLTRKQNNNFALKDFTSKRDSKDVIPYSSLLIKKYHLSTQCNISLRKNLKNIQRKKMLAIKNVVDTTDWKEFYKNNISENIYWERITDIKDSKNDVYDFSLYNKEEKDEFNHSVVYNGIIGHQTPNGENHYYDFWTKAVNGKSNMVPYEVNWWDVPGRDEEWRKETLKNMSEDQFNVEYGNSFDSGSNTLISPYIFARLSKNILSPVQSTSTMKIYETPIKNHKYILTVDCAQGTGLDYSTISVIDITTYPYKQVATFKDNEISHLSFPQIIMQLGTKYNMAEVLIESNDIGNTILHILNYDIEYENIVKTFAGVMGKPILGQKTTIKTKSVGCARIKDMVEGGLLIVQDIDTLNEFRHFSLSGQSYAADNGYHDDLVMGLVNFAYYASTPQFRMKYDENFTDEYRREYDEKIMETLAPLPIFSSNISNVDAADIAWLKD